MKTNITRIGVASLAIGICVWSTEARAQSSTTVTTTKGAFTEYVPGAQTVVVRSETNPTPLRYVVSKQTTIVDEAGAPVTIERIAPGSALSVGYTGTGDRLVASRIVVQKAATVTAPVTTAPAVTQQQTTTTTSTTRALTDDEEDDIEDAKERRKEALEDDIEQRKEALDKAKDRLDDDD